MNEQQTAFIDFLVRTGALIFDDRQLKSGRTSPYFVNLGELNDGASSSVIGNAYAQAVLDSDVSFNHIFGVPDKAVGLERLVSSKLYESNHQNKSWLFMRKVPKTHGEATGAVGSSKEERRRSMIVGTIPQAGSQIILVDDVLTTGAAKYDSIKDLTELLDDPKFTGLFIAVDRQEVGVDGKSAVESFTSTTGIPVFSVVNSAEILNYLREQGRVANSILNRMERYLRVYGTPEARKDLPVVLEQKIVEEERSVVVACDVTSIGAFEKLVKETADVEGVSSYKLGFSLGLRYGLPKLVEIVKEHAPHKKVIYDHQKASTDIPDTGKDFAVLCSEAGVDAVILFPQSGPETERAWIYHALDRGLGVIVGGRMTHPAYAESEGGWITDKGAIEMYRLAARAGVNNFVVPGNKPDVIKQIREAITSEGVPDPIFYSPGFGKRGQGGKISEAAIAAGSRRHAIVGRDIYNAPDIKEAAEFYVKQVQE